jgi:hypothetical protein
MGEDWRKFIRNAKIEYNKIRTVHCPAFNNESIHFSREGFNHLLRKGPVLRKRSEQWHRISLLHAAVVTLKYAQAYSACRESNKADSSARFWSFDGRHRGARISVIVRQINENNKHFFSVIPK